MQVVEIKKLDGTKAKVTVGYGLIPAATQHLRETRTRLFNAEMQLLKGVADPTLVQPEIMKTIEEYKATQNPEDGEVRLWLTTTEGLRFVLHHGTRRDCKLDMDQAIEILDEITEEDYSRLQEAVDKICLGADRLERRNKIMEAMKQADAIRTDRMISNLKKGRPAGEGLDQPLDQPSTSPPADRAGDTDSANVPG